jgi:uncharacterized membrane protein (UPF0136 family)
VSTVPTEPGPFAAPPAPAFDWLVLARGLAGAIVGGVVGYFVFRWLSRNGFLSHMVPGMLLGLGAGLAARGRSLPLGIICALASLVLGVFSEWMRAPFVDDPSFTFFVAHLSEMRGASVKLVMIGLGAAGAFWFGQGR